MFESAITWAQVIGALIFGLGATMYFGPGDKTAAIWIGFAGALILLLGFCLTLQKGVWDQAAAAAVQPLSASLPAPRPRAWLAVEATIAGPLTFDSGIGLPLRITISNNTAIPALDAVPVPMIFVREPQPFRAEDVIKRRTANFATGGGLGYSVFPGKSVTELNTPSNVLTEFAGATLIAPFVLVAVKYKTPGSDETHLTADLYALVRSRPGGGLGIDPNAGTVPAVSLILAQVGSFAN